MATDAKDHPQFFSDSSEFASKAELCANKTQFCVMDVEDKEGKFGKKWHISISCEGEDELKCITFGHGDPAISKRETEFQQLMENADYLPIHACRLKQWSFEGKSGYRIAARSGSGPCPCKPAPVSINPFSSTLDDDIDGLPDLQ